MKKQYIQPHIDIVEIATNSLICSSINLSNTGANNDVALGRPGFFDIDDEEY